jgi:hypothetical protein
VPCPERFFEQRRDSHDVLGKCSFPTSKLKATLFWDRSGVLMAKFMQEGDTVNVGNAM